MEEDSPTVAGYYDGGKQALNKVGTDLRNPPIRARIEMQRRELQTRIELLDKTLALLDSNPAIEEFQNLVGKLGCL